MDALVAKDFRQLHVVISTSRIIDPTWPQLPNFLHVITP